MCKMNKLLSLLIIISIPNYLFTQELVVSEQTGIESEISIAVNPGNPDEIVIASMGTNAPIIIYTSDDGGESWNQSAFGDGVADPVLTYGDNNTVYLTYLDFGNTLEMYLARSTNNGVSWDIEGLTLDGLAADRQWIKRDNNPSSPYYGNIYLSYFHPEVGPDIHIVKIDSNGTIGNNLPVHSLAYTFVQNPAIDVTTAGDLIVCFIAEEAGDDRKIVAVSSTDAGSTFTVPTTVTDLNMYDNNGNPVIDVVGFAPGDASRLGNSLQMAVDKSTGPFAGRTYLSWTDFVVDNPGEGMNIYLSHSDDNGLSWSTPKIVNDDGIPSSHQYYAGIDVNPNGVLCLSWYDRRSDPINDALTDFYFTTSSDGGETFTTSTKVNTLSSDHTAVTNGLVTFGVGEYTSLATTTTQACLVWSDGRENNGDMDVYFAKVSLDNINNIAETRLQPTILIEQLTPNPATSGKLELTLYTRQTSEIIIAIIDVGGRVIREEKINVSTVGQTILPLDIGGLSSGNYFIQVRQQNGVAISKVTITD